MLIMEETALCFPLPRGKKRIFDLGKLSFYAPNGSSLACKRILLHGVVKIAT